MFKKGTINFMNFRKFIILIMTLCSLCACDKKEVVEVEESKEPFVIQYFYAQGCPHCKQLKENFIARVQEEFGDQVTIVAYDIDEEGSVELYDSYIGLYDMETNTWVVDGKLDGVGADIANYERYIPLVIVGDSYAFMGYSNDLLNAYIQDVHLMLKGKKLATGDVSSGRWYFKENP